MKDTTKDTVQGLFKGGSIVFVGLALELGISFFAKILMARVLGQVDYGIATLGVKVLSFSSAILLLGLNNGIGRYLPRFDETANRKGVILSALELAIPVAAIVAVVFGLFAESIAINIFRTPEAAPVLRAAAVGVPFAVLLKLSIGVVQGMEQTIPKVFIRNIFQPVLRFVLIAAVLVFGLGSIGIVWAYTVTFVVAAVAGGYYIVTRTPLVERIRGTRIRRELLVFSAPLMMMTSMMMIMSNFDIFFISYFHSPSAIGVYNVVYPLAELLTMTLSGFSFIFLPTFSRLHAEKEQKDMKRVYQVVTKWIFFITLPGLFLFVLFPKQTIGISFGWEYSEGALALSVLSIGFFVQSIAGPNVQSLTSIGETRTIMVLNMIAASANILLNYLLIPQYSYLGAAVATSVSYTMLNLLYSTALYRRTGIHPFSPALLKPALVSVTIMLAIFGVVSFTLPESVITVFFSFSFFLILYLVVLLRLGAVEEEEIMLLLSIEERFGVDLSRVKQLARRIMGGI